MSLVKTYLQDIRTSYPSNLDRDETRVTMLGLMEGVLQMTNSANSIVSSELVSKAEMSQGRNLDVPVMQKGNVTVNNVRSCTVACGQSESDLVRVVWKTVSADICMVPSQYEKNDIKYLGDLNFKIKQVVEAFGIVIENDLDTAFDANKSQVYNSSIIGTKYPLVGDAMRVTQAQTDFFFNDLNSINISDDFESIQIKIIASPSVMPVVEKYINQGVSNSANTSFQYFGKDFTFSNRVTNGVGVLGTGYFMPDGSIGMITRVDVDARLNHTATTGTQWFQETLPGLPFPVGIKYDSQCSDQSTLEVAGLTHLTATMVEHYQISFDFAIIVPYNSDLTTKPSSIRKFEFVA